LIDFERIQRILKTRPAWTGVEYCGTDCRKEGKLVKQIRKMKNLNKEFDPKLDLKIELK
jgi:hypothetical protein